MVERVVYTDDVGGSSPSFPTKIKDINMLSDIVQMGFALCAPILFFLVGTFGAMRNTTSVDDDGMAYRNGVYFDRTTGTWTEEKSLSDNYIERSLR